MDSIRDFLKSWPGRILLIICLSPLVILGLESYFSGGSSANEVVKVGDQVITRAEYQEAINNKRSELAASGIDASYINNAQLNEEVLKGLINRALLRQHSEKLGMHLSDEIINDMLIQDPQFLDENGQFSNERFAYVLKQAGITKDQLFENYRQQLNVRQLFSGIVQTAIYPNSQVDNFLALHLKTRSVWVHRLPWKNFEKQVSVDNNEIEAYYKEHANEQNSLKMVDLSYVVLDPAKTALEPVTEEDIQAQYNLFKTSYGDQYTQQLSQILLTGDNATSTIEKIQKRIKNGEKFSVLAKEFSEDPISRKKGGDIGTFNPEAFGEDGEKVALAIKDLKKGEISDPVKTRFGYQIFQVTNIEGNDIPSLDSMREELVTRAENQKRESFIADKITRINEMATDGVSIEDIAQQEELQVKTLKDYTELSNTTVLNQPAVIEAAFDEYALHDESVSTSISVNNQIVWVQPTNYRPIKPLTLEQATADIEQILVKEKATELALAKAKDIALKVNNGGLDAVDISFESLGELSRQTPQLTSIEKAVVFSQNTTPDKLLATSQATDMGATVLVMDVINQKTADQVSAAERMMVAGNEKQSRGLEEFSDYLDYLETATKVVKNESVINEITGI